MATIEQVKAQIQSLIDASNEKTGQASADLTSAVNVLIEGYGTGGGSTEVDILAEQEITAEYYPEGGMAMYQWDKLLGLKEGETYIVNYDGVKYECTAKNLDGVFVGNSVFVGQENTGEPFAIADTSMGVSMMCTFDTETTTHTVRIYQVKSGGSSDSDLVKWVTFMSEDGSEMGKRAVINGDDCPEPVADGLFAKPTKASTAQYSYAYAGWSTTNGGSASSTALANVTEDRKVYVAFSATLRSYTVNFYDDSTLKKSVTLNYGESYDYTLEKSGYIFMGWNPEPKNITGNMDCYAQWRVDDGMIYEDWDVVKANVESGKYSSLYKVGNKKELTVNYSDGTSETFNMVLAQINPTCDFYEDKTKPTLVFIADKQLKEAIDPLTDNSQTKYEQTNVYTHLHNNILPCLPETLQNVLVNNYKGPMASYAINYGKIWIPAAKEIWNKNQSDSSYGWSATTQVQYELFKNETNKCFYPVGSETYRPFVFGNIGYSNTRPAIMTSGKNSLSGGTPTSESGVYTDTFGLVIGFCL